MDEFSLLETGVPSIDVQRSTFSPYPFFFEAKSSDTDLQAVLAARKRDHESSFKGLVVPDTASITPTQELDFSQQRLPSVAVLGKRTREDDPMDNNHNTNNKVTNNNNKSVFSEILVPNSSSDDYTPNQHNTYTYDGSSDTTPNQQYDQDNIDRSYDYNLAGSPPAETPHTEPQQQQQEQEEQEDYTPPPKRRRRATTNTTTTKQTKQTRTKRQTKKSKQQQQQDEDEEFDVDEDGGSSQNNNDGDMSEKTKRQMRLVKNRQAAHQFRQRQKQHVKSLEEQVAVLSKDNEDLKATLVVSNNENSLLKSEITYLRQFNQQLLQLSMKLQESGGK